MTKHVIVGTAGHIDHGKTALVEALTGINADRWEEERRRGITIDLGFAYLKLPNSAELGFVDVPGHERFVRNMLAGAGGIDVALLVVAADESIMPQTREHFDICRLLGIPRGVIAITKSDLAGPDILDLVRLEIAEFVRGSFLESAPAVPVSARTGAGLDALRQELADAAAEVRAKDAGRRFRLPVDRAFVMRGFGPVVTGTLLSGAVALEAEVEIHPGGKHARVRGIQTHGEARERAEAGQRTALNLAGVNASGLRRGLVLSEPGVLQSTAQFDCLLELLPSAKPLRHGSPVHFHAGAAEIEGRVFLLERAPGQQARNQKLDPGAKAFAQIRLAEPALLLPGDRFVIRRFSPVTTIGGGAVLDNNAARREPFVRRKRRLEALLSGNRQEILERLLEDAPLGLEGAAIVSRTGWTDDELSSALAELEASGAAVRVRERPPLAIHRSRLDDAAEKLLAELGEFHAREPLAPGKPLQTLRAWAGGQAALADLLLGKLVAAKRIAIEGEFARLASHRVELREDEERARRKIVEAFEQAGLAVPALKDFLPGVGVDLARARTLLAALLREGILVKATEDLIFHRAALDELLAKLAKRKAESPRLTVPEFKDLAGVSRKYAIPLLEYLDKRRVTRREGDARLIL